MVRETIWGDIVATNSSLAAANTAILANVTGAAFLALRPFTAIRTRGILYLISDQTAAAEIQAVNFGVAVVSDQAVAIGITAIPTPTTDAASDSWFVYQSIMAAHGAGTVDSEQGKLLEYDSRAMRKVEDGSQLVFVLETGDAAVTAGVNIRHFGRLLLKLH